MQEKEEGYKGVDEEGKGGTGESLAWIQATKNVQAMENLSHK